MILSSVGFWSFIALLIVASCALKKASGDCIPGGLNDLYKQIILVGTDAIMSQTMIWRFLISRSDLLLYLISLWM